MLRSFSTFRHFRFAATDGEIGEVREFLVDDQSWTVRYIVVNTGGWLTGRKVLISPRSLGEISDESKIAAVHLSKAQIEKSPHIEEQASISRAYEADWHLYYGFPGYWQPPLAFGIPPLIDFESGMHRLPQEVEDLHLYSTSEVLGYSIHATDGEIGHVDDFIVEDDGWIIRYIVISLRWWPGQKTILSSEWIERICGEEMQVCVPLTRQAIKDAPIWNETEPMTRSFEDELHEHYGRTRYWPIEL